MFVITGGGSGIGRSLAKSLAMRGKSVLVVGRRRAMLQETAELAPTIDYFAADLSTEKGCNALIERLQSVSIQGLIHNAGVIEPIATLSEYTYQAWQDCLHTNLNAPFLLTKELLPQLQAGRMLHIGSGAAYFPVKGWGAYCVSKAALSMLMRCWQIEEPNFICTSVMPGIIDTAMQAAIRSSISMSTDKRDFFQELQDTQRLLTADTVAVFLTWLLLDVAPKDYVAKEWDIYDTTHHLNWLQAPHMVPPLVA